MCKSDICNLTNDKFKQFYLKSYKKHEQNDSHILLREPIDHSYNPAKGVDEKHMDEILYKIRNCYYSIIKYGEYIEK